MGFKDSDLYREMTWPLAMVCAYSSIAGAGFGYDNLYWGGFLGIQQFIKDFGVWDSSTQGYIIPASWQSVGSGAPMAGVSIGCLVSGLVGNRFGRRKTFLLAGVIAVVGILIQVTAFEGFWQLIAGRIINSVSMGLICNVVPTYQSEIAPAKIRGALVNAYQFWELFGALMACTADWAFQWRQDQWAYRATLILQFVIPIILLIGGFVLPESPRWLIEKGRTEEARKNLQFLRGGAIPAHVIEEEVVLLTQATSEQKQIQNTTTWLDCFKGSNRRRTAIATGVQCLQQAQGNSFILSYAVVFLKALGIKINSLKINLLLVFVNFCGSSVAFWFVDKLGRRRCLFWGAVVLAACMYVVAGLVTGAPNDPQGMKGVLAALFIWNFVQAFSWSSCVWIVTSETPTLLLREKTVTISTFSGFATGVIVTFVSPYIQDAGYGNLQGKIGFLWGSFSVVSAVWTWFFMPELKGRSLEELDEMFEGKVGVREFAGWETKGVGRKIRVVEERGGFGEVTLGVEGGEEEGVVEEEKNRDVKALQV